MLFSSFIFLSLFLPCVLCAYYLAPARIRNAVLLVASLIFYAWGDFNYLGILLGVVMLNYLGALLLDAVAVKGHGDGLRRMIVAAFVCADVSVLFYFKYFDFVARNVSALTGLDFALHGVVLPLGISFYTFQSISYLVDVYRGEIPVQRNLLTLALFITCFPQLVAGPILKYHDVWRAIESRRETLAHFAYGVRRFTMGLAKKVLVANTMGAIADAVFSERIGDFGAVSAWGGAVAYSLQLYFDFSGYSDMAIGLGAMFGFQFLENFNYPYVSKSITEFWRRWHISLSTWFKEYVYIPLGGNRVSKPRNLFNLGFVFLLTGIWHGAEWTFVVWGVYHGAFILVEKITGWHKKEGRPWLDALHHAYLVLVVILGWVVFRAPTLQYAFGYVGVMFGLVHTEPVRETSFYFTHFGMFVMAVALVVSAGVFKPLQEWAARSRLAGVMCDAWILALLFATMVFLAGSSYNPFIYFRF